MTNRSRRPKSRCSCGVWRSSSPHSPSHESSFAHLHGPEIRQMMMEELATLKQVAARFGVSRERVRQVVAAMRLETGEVRRWKRTSRRRRLRPPPPVPRLLREFREAAAAQGLTVDAPVPVGEAARAAWTVRALPPTSRWRLVEVNGRWVYLLRCFRAAGRPRGLILRPPRLPAAVELARFVAYRLPDGSGSGGGDGGGGGGNVGSGGKWLILPASRLPPHATMFHPGLQRRWPRSRSGMSPRYRHDWRDYLEAWEQLQPKPKPGRNETKAK